MTYKSLILAIGLSSLSTAAFADAQTDFVFFDAQIAALQHRVDAGATSPSVKPEALTALQGKQQELVNQEAKLKAAGAMTPDEKTALGLSIREQQQRIATLTQAKAPAMRHVDPASVPAPTYVAPNGTTISGPVGTSAAGNGVMVSTPIMPAPTVTAPTMAAPTVVAPTVAAPTVPVVHAPMPATTNDAPAQ